MIIKKLSENIEKIEYRLFNEKRYIINVPISIKINLNIISASYLIKHHGVIFQSDMFMDKHII